MTGRNAGKAYLAVVTGNRLLRQNGNLCAISAAEFALVAVRERKLRACQRISAVILLLEDQLTQIALHRRNREFQRLLVGNLYLAVHRLNHAVFERRCAVGLIHVPLDKAVLLVLQSHPVVQRVDVGRRAADDFRLVAGLLEVPGDGALVWIKHRRILCARFTGAGQAGGIPFACLVVQPDKLNCVYGASAADRHRVRRHPVRLARALDGRLDGLKNLLISIQQAIRIGTIVVVSRADAVAQPVLIGFCARRVADLIACAGPVHNGEATCLFTLGDVLLNGLTADVHADGEDRRARIFDALRHVPCTDCRFVGIAGAIRRRFVQHMVIEDSAGRIIGVIAAIAASDIGCREAV